MFGLCFASTFVIAAVKRRLAVIDVPDRPDVHVRLAAIKFFLRHVIRRISLTELLPSRAWPLPRNLPLNPG